MSQIQSSSVTEGVLPTEPVIQSLGISVKIPSILRSLSSGRLVPPTSGRVRSRDSTGSITDGGEIQAVENGSRRRSGSASLISTKWGTTKLCLTESSLYYETPTGQVLIVKLEDLIGIQVKQNPPTNNNNACEMCINYYPVVTRSSSRTTTNGTRKLISVTVQVDGETTFKKNLAATYEMKKSIKLHTNRALNRLFCLSDLESLQLSEDESLLVARQFLVFINPAGGPGKAVSQFKQHVKPLFDMAEIYCNMFVTERQNHARDIVKAYDISKIHAIIIASGDGLLHEVVNGLLDREDWERAIKVPIGMLPTGSGNALAASTLLESNEEFSLTNAAFQIISGGVIPMDIATVHTGDGGKCYMTILGGWGIVADTDIESERFRMIGDTRFVLGAVSCIIKKRLYKGRLSFLMEGNDTTQQKAVPVQTDGEHDKEHKLTQSHTESDTHHEEIQDSTQSTQVDSKLTDNTHQTTTMEAHETETETVTIANTNTLSKTVSKPLQEASHEGCVKGFSPFGPATKLLPNLSEPVPPSWETIEKEFLSISILMIPFLSSGIYGDPNVSIGDGKIRLLIADGQIKRMEILEMFNKTETGEHTEMKQITRKDVKAFRLEPITEPGTMTIDGEEVYYGPLQCQIHPGLARVMCRKRK